jgi:adenine-specific DNA methylase
MNSPTQKSLGAYYTDRTVAGFLASWAIRLPTDAVLDPSCGDGVFLTAAAAHLSQLGASHPFSIKGVEIDKEAVRSLAGVPLQPGAIITENFFNVALSDLGRVSAVIGNPPFIRYHAFNGSSRAAALAACANLGVTLPSLTSSWAPFVVYSASFLEPGGRLAMVVPTEIGHASYALPVLRWLADSFHSIRLVAFREPLFPDLSQDTFCLLAEGFGYRCESFTLVVADSARTLRGLDLDSGTPVDISALVEGRHRLVSYFLSAPARLLYHSLANHPRTPELGRIADVGIGYVSGANDFFHLTKEDIRTFSIPDTYLRPALRSGSQLSGLSYTKRDWQVGFEEGRKVTLLLIPADARRLAAGVRRYIGIGMNTHVNESYKCLQRDPWYAVPSVYTPDAFLTYMTGTVPKLVANRADAVATNTLHIVRLNRALDRRPAELAYFWHTSLVMLSCELEGHALGGGMLKMEPTEAERIRLPLPSSPPEPSKLKALDTLLRAHEYDAAFDVSDKEVMMNRLRFTRNEAQTFRDAAYQLSAWRTRRSRRSSPAPSVYDRYRPQRVGTVYSPKGNHT